MEPPSLRATERRGVPLQSRDSAKEVEWRNRSYFALMPKKRKAGIAKHPTESIKIDRGIAGKEQERVEGKSENNNSRNRRPELKDSGETRNGRR